MSTLLSVLIIAIPGVAAEYLVARSARGLKALGWIALVVSWFLILGLTVTSFNPMHGSWGGLGGAVVWIGSMIDRVRRNPTARPSRNESSSEKANLAPAAVENVVNNGAKQSD
jgi:hypothetical protein